MRVGGGGRGGGGGGGGLSDGVIRICQSCPALFSWTLDLLRIDFLKMGKV